VAEIDHGGVQWFFDVGNFTQQAAHVLTLHPLRRKLLPLQFLYGLDRVRANLPLVHQPAKEPAQRDDRTVDGGDCLALVTAQCVLEVSHVTSGDPPHDERLVVGPNKPPGKLPQVLDHRLAAVVGEVVGIEEAGGCINTSMWTSFNNWLASDTDYLLHLLEVSTEFPRMELNELFDRQINRLLRQVQQPEVRRSLEKSRGFDWVAYIAKSLRNANLPHHEIDAETQGIVVKLLVHPGTLFRGWHDQPILARFKVAVRNAVLNRLEKCNRRRRWFPHVSPEDVEMAMHSAPGDEEILEKFRAEVQKQLGTLALAVLDARLDGLDVKSLVGNPDVMSPSAYQVKKAVQEIKALPARFGDEQFQAQVQRMMNAEQQTLARRSRTAAPAAV